MQNSISIIWAKTIIDQLVEDQHDYFCISPGSRSTPLILAIDSQQKARSFIHFDERSLAFHALGYSKIAEHAPVVVVTSGTACGNLLPAIMESFESSTPLILLTADRPLELQDSGANQTTRYQPSLYKNFVCYELNLPAPDAKSLENLRHLIHRASYLLKKNKKSVHINCSFREPFEFPTDFSINYSAPPLFSYSFQKSIPANLAKEVATFINAAKKGLILLGSEGLKNQEGSSLQSLVKHLQWPIFADPLSLWSLNEFNIKNYSLILKQQQNLSLYLEELSFDCILHIGGSFVSKHLSSFLKKSPPKIYIHVHHTDTRYDPTHLVTHKLELDSDTFSREILQFTEQQEKKSLWFELSTYVQTSVDNFFLENNRNSEPYFFWMLGNCISSSTFMFIGNSMPIRDLTDFFHPNSYNWQIYGNRGLSGIDGNIATAAGISRALNQPLIVIIGDQTFLHDATSVSQLSNLQAPLKLIVLNNSGGQIFSHLPIGMHKDICEKYFINPLNADLKFFAHAFQISYQYFEDVETFFSNQECLKSNECCIIEIKTQASINLETHKLLSITIKDVISSFFCSV